MAATDKVFALDLGYLCVTAPSLRRKMGTDRMGTDDGWGLIYILALVRHEYEISLKCHVSSHRNLALFSQIFTVATTYDD